MSVLDAILQRAPGLIAQGLEAKRVRGQMDEQRDMQRAGMVRQQQQDDLARQRDEQARRRQIEQDAIQRALLGERQQDAQQGRQLTALQIQKAQQGLQPQAIQPEWQREGFQDQGEYFQFLKSKRQATTAPQQAPQGQIFTGADGQVYRLVGNRAVPVQIEGGPGLQAPTKAAGGGAAASEGERKGAVAYDRALQAEQELQSLDANASPGAVQRLFSGSDFANRLASPETQQFQTAADAFVTAVLRGESGAAISEDELKTGRRMWIPRPNDSPEVLAQKARLRQVAIQSLRNSAGRATSGEGAEIPPRPSASGNPPTTPRPSSGGGSDLFAKYGLEERPRP